MLQVHMKIRRCSQHTISQISLEKIDISCLTKTIVLAIATGEYSTAAEARCIELTPALGLEREADEFLYWESKRGESGDRPLND